jgi:hypothetical protein
VPQGFFAPLSPGRDGGDGGLRRPRVLPLLTGKRGVPRHPAWSDPPRGSFIHSTRAPPRGNGYQKAVTRFASSSWRSDGSQAQAHRAARWCVGSGSSSSLEGFERISGLPIRSRQSCFGSLKEIERISGPPIGSVLSCCTDTVGNLLLSH